MEKFIPIVVIILVIAIVIFLIFKENNLGSDSNFRTDHEQLNSKAYFECQDVNFLELNKSQLTNSKTQRSCNINIDNTLLTNSIFEMNLNGKTIGISILNKISTLTKDCLEGENANFYKDLYLGQNNQIYVCSGGIIGI